jgi:hypothetical protein
MLMMQLVAHMLDPSGGYRSFVLHAPDAIEDHLQKGVTAMVAREESSLVVLYTHRFVIEGRVALVPGARLTDFLRESREFIAVVDVTLRRASDHEILKQLPFLDVRRDCIELAYPADNA